jgi:hypothetical protein
MIEIAYRYWIVDYELMGNIDFIMLVVALISL